MDVFINGESKKVADSGVLIVGDKGAFYSADDYCGVYELRWRAKSQGRL